MGKEEEEKGSVSYGFAHTQAGSKRKRGGKRRKRGVWADRRREGRAPKEKTSHHKIPLPFPFASIQPLRTTVQLTTLPRKTLRIRKSLLLGVPSKSGWGGKSNSPFFHRQFFSGGRPIFMRELWKEGKKQYPFFTLASLLWTGREEWVPKKVWKGQKVGRFNG